MINSEAFKLQIPDRDFIDRQITWYQTSQRDLPWRNTSNPYHVWLSEIMLQQTRVKAVIPYFERFLREYPSLEKLAKADEPRVLDLWAGLGYYSRARNLLKTARLILENHQGRFPESFDQVISLPGIGRYTAGAILSIAFKKPLPILDGNIRRLFLRFLGIESPVDSILTARLWKTLELLVDQVPPESISDFNQSLMELGALVCTPKNPRCHDCPLQDFCEAFLAGTQDRIPRRKRKKQTEELSFVCLIFRSGNLFLMTKSNNQPYLKGFWDFPKLETQPDDPSIQIQFQRAIGLEFDKRTELEPIPHQITFRKMTFHPWIADLKNHLNETTDLKWIDPDQPGYPKPAYVKKILDKLT